MAEEIVKTDFWQDQLKTLQALLSEWISLLRVLLRPAIFLPLAIAVVALWIANASDLSKDVKLILNIVASLASGVAAGFVALWWNEVSGKTIVVKKGQSAIRNLTLIREKTKNIGERTRSKGNLEEIGNLLSLLEKDLGNSIKDWNDILPGVVLEIETLYARLDQKEIENEDIRNKVESLKRELGEQQSWEAGEKEELKQLIATKEKEAADLKAEINELKHKTSTATSSSILSEATMFRMPRKLAAKIAATTTFCKKCGNFYQMQAIGENGLCANCKAEKT